MIKPLGSIHYTSKISAPHCTDAQVMSSPVFPSLDDIYCIRIFFSKMVCIDLISESKREYSTHVESFYFALLIVSATLETITEYVADYHVWMKFGSHFLAKCVIGRSGEDELQPPSYSVVT